MNVRGSIPTKISCSRNSGDRRKLHSPFLWLAQLLKSWRNSPRHSQITWPIGLGGYSSVRIQKKHAKFTVAELHNNFRAMPCRCCQEDTARSAANPYKDMQRRLGVVQSLKGNIFFSNILLLREWYHLSIESDRPRAMIWLFILCAFAFYSFQYLLGFWALP